MKILLIISIFIFSSSLFIIQGIQLVYADRCDDNGDGTCDYYDDSGNYGGTSVIGGGDTGTQGPEVQGPEVQGPPVEQPPAPEAPAPEAPAPQPQQGPAGPPGPQGAPAPAAAPAAPSFNISNTNENTNNNTNNNSNTTTVTNNSVNQNSNSSSSSSSSNSTNTTNVSVTQPQGGVAAAPQARQVAQAQPQVVPQVVRVAGVSTTEVKELPKTGLPLLAWAAGAFIPAGLGLKKFGKKIVEDMAGHPQFMWDERQFKKI